MTAPAARTLDFDALDELAFAAERGRLNGRAVPHLKAQTIGPVVELCLLAADGKLPAPRAATWLSLGGLDAMMRALDGGARQWICRETRQAGYLRTDHATGHKDTVWTGFAFEAQKAAARAGFPKAIAAQFAAALGELHSNIHEHSENPTTGVIVFRAPPGRFELVAADRGIGVLKSLCSNEAYQDLRDHGAALRLALSEGVSRYGPGAGRGYGFRPLFVGLANLNGALRFRSGDHALLMDGQNPSLVTARSAQKAATEGFLVSVCCERGR